MLKKPQDRDRIYKINKILERLSNLVNPVEIEPIFPISIKLYFLLYKPAIPIPAVSILNSLVLRIAYRGKPQVASCRLQVASYRSLLKFTRVAQILRVNSVLRKLCAPVIPSAARNLSCAGKRFFTIVYCVNCVPRHSERGEESFVIGCLLRNTQYAIAIHRFAEMAEACKQPAAYGLPG